ncbi:MAG: MraY family glycosyltransferase [Bacteroidales bacterium]
MQFHTEMYNLFIPPAFLIAGASLFSFIITFFSIPSVVRVSQIKGLVAHPNGRTTHTYPTPNLGGVAIFAGVIISSVIFTGIPTAHELKYMIAAMLIIFFVGLKDDMYPMVAYKKAIGQISAVVIIMIPGNFYVTSLHGFFGIYTIPYGLSLGLTFILFLALINSFNLIDGIDGLASGIGIICSVFFGIVFLKDKHLSYAIMGFILAASLLAFFYFNVLGKKNKIFLGDTGSMLIGLLLAIFAVRFMNFDSSTMYFKNNASPGVLFLVLIVPLFDTARVFLLRLLRKQSPFQADRTHIHHRLHDICGSHIKATGIILLVNLVFILLALFLRRINNELMILLGVALATFLSYIPIFITKRRSVARN